MKIDRRKKYYMVIDTETCPITQQDTVDPDNMLAYDIGWVICDKKGKIYERKSFLNGEIFLAEHEKMCSAYYANKIPSYWEKIYNEEIKVKSYDQIKYECRKDIDKYKVEKVFAHNMRFDYWTLRKTQDWLKKSFFFPYGIEICDTLKMSRSIMKQRPSYKRFCQKHGYMTKNNQPRFTAEILTRYITDNQDFVESHTALEDAIIESQILAFCFKQHKAMKYRLWEK